MNSDSVLALNVEHCHYNYLAEDGDEGIKRDGSLMGWSTSQSTEDKVQWWGMIVALCPSWDEEDKKGSTAGTDVSQ